MENLYEVETVRSLPRNEFRGYQMENLNEVSFMNFFAYASGGSGISFCGSRLFWLMRVEKMRKDKEQAGYDQRNYENQKGLHVVVCSP